MTNKKQFFIILSIVVFILDFTFVAINYISSKNALDYALLSDLQEKEINFNHTLSMVYRNMLQISEYYAHNEELNQLFLLGKKTVKAEGGGAGAEQSSKVRQALLDKLKPGWDNMSSHFKFRHLHYHFEPGSLSFLRVHKAEKYGDQLDDFRHIIVDTNNERKPLAGFETGRISSGLRGVSPVWATDPDTGQETYVGALEVSTSFEQILPLISNNYRTNFAVLLTKKHIKKNIWPELLEQSITKYIRSQSKIDFYVESSTSTDLNVILLQLNVSNDFIRHNIELIKFNDRYLSVYYFPFRDYQATQNDKLPPIGLVLLWDDVTERINDFNSNIIVNFIVAFIGLFIIQITLYMLFRHEVKLTNNAMYDGLTEILNRRHFDENYKLELRRAKRNKQTLSLILCDIDYFKQFNDTYGHLSGDECLREVARVLKKTVKRAGDCVARYGGEEFTILLPDTKLETAIKIAERLRNEIEQLKIPHSASQVSQYVTISLGVSSTESVLEADEILYEADVHLYSAKDKGRNQVAYKS